MGIVAQFFLHALFSFLEGCVCVLEVSIIGMEADATIYTSKMYGLLNTKWTNEDNIK